MSFVDDLNELAARLFADARARVGREQCWECGKEVVKGRLMVPLFVNKHGVVGQGHGYYCLDCISDHGQRLFVDWLGACAALADAALTGALNDIDDELARLRDIHAQARLFADARESGALDAYDYEENY